MGPRWERAIHFTALTYGLSFLFVGAMHVAGISLQTPLGTVLAAIYMYMPTLATLFLMKLIYREPMKDALGLRLQSNLWLVVGWIAPLALLPIVLVVGYAFPGVGFDPGMTDFLERMRATLPPERFAEMQRQLDSLPVNPVLLQLLAAPIAGATINALAAFGEEFGWRGFLQHALGPIGLWPSSIIIGVIWGAWHAPFIMMGHNYPHHPYTGILMMIVFTTLLAPIISYVRIRAGNVYAAAAFHGTLNACAGFPLVLSSAPDELLTGYTGLAGFIVLFLTNVGIYFYDKHSPTGIIGRRPAAGIIGRAPAGSN